MYNNTEDLQTFYEKKIKELSTELMKLRNFIKDIQSNSEMKDKQIDRLNNENTQIRTRLHKMQLSSSAIQSNSPIISPQSTESAVNQPTDLNPTSYYNAELVNPDTYNAETGFKKRECPKCGAMGFAIKEFEDKTRIISYIPRRIYAMKRVCTKCRHEF